MDTTMNVQPVIIRYHRGNAMDDAEIIIFVPDMPAKQDFIACYSHTGQHSEASMKYYNETKLLHYAPPLMQAEAQQLLKEYRLLCEVHGQKMKIVMKDTALFRSARWNWHKVRSAYEAAQYQDKH